MIVSSLSLSPRTAIARSRLNIFYKILFILEKAKKES